MTSQPKATSPMKWIFGVCLMTLGIVLILHGALATASWTAYIVSEKIPAPDILLGGLVFFLGYRLSRGFARERKIFYKRLTEQKKALSAAEKIGDEAAIVTACDQLSSLAMKKGDVESAAAYCARILETKIAHIPENRERLIAIYIRLARIASQASNKYEVEQWITKAREVSPILPAQQKLQLNIEIGIIYSVMKQYDFAHEILSTSLKESERLGFNREAAAAYHELGMIARNRGELDSAEDYLRKALANKEEGNDEELNSTYSELGICAATRGKYIEAGQWFLQSYRSAQNCKAVYSMDRALQNFLLNYRNAPSPERQKLREMWRDAGLGPLGLK